jgi:hypothetical protein
MEFWELHTAVGQVTTAIASPMEKSTPVRLAWIETTG